MISCNVPRCPSSRDCILIDSLEARIVNEARSAVDYVKNIRIATPMREATTSKSFVHISFRYSSNF